MKLIKLLFISVIVTGCANMSQSIQNSAGVGLTTVSESSFDGSKEISMAPAWVLQLMVVW